MITQEQFNTMIRGLDAQGWQRSYDDDQDQCVYRSPSGRKCAIGQLIPDEIYEPGMDRPGDPWQARHFHDVDLLTNITDAELRQIQTLHDEADDQEDMKRRFKEYADANNLTWPLS